MEPSSSRLRMWTCQGPADDSGESQSTPPPAIVPPLAEVIAIVRRRRLKHRRHRHDTGTSRSRAEEEEGVMRGCLRERLLLLLFAAAQNPHSVATKRAVERRGNLVVSWLHPPAPFLVPCTIRERGFDGDQQAALIKVHNEYRSLVAKDLAAVAQSYVEQCAPQAKVPEARDFLEEGQNLCVQTLPGSGNDTGWEACVAAWFSEHTDCPKGIIGSYRNTSDRGEPSCEHFTQLVWSRSQYVGCGFALVQSSDGATRNLYACNYDEPGNHPGTAVYLTGPPLLVLPEVHEVRYAAGLVPDRPAAHRAARLRGSHRRPEEKPWRRRRDV
ncbi:hypothetical protein MTO96_029710 [Rhipicephalus appendiculatus]